MGITKNEVALTLATIVLGTLIGTGIIGVGTGFVFGDIKITQEQFDQSWDFLLLFAGAALMYFGFRAGQSNGRNTAQS